MAPREVPPTFYSCKSIEEGQLFRVHGATLRAVYSPGHTSDHVAFVLEEESSLFTGDCVLGEGTAVFENLKIYLESLQKLQSLDITRCYPGYKSYSQSLSHGPVIEDGKTAINDYISHRLKREEQIVHVLESDPQRTWTPMDVVVILYKGYPEDLYPAAARGVELHLGKLEEEGRVSKRDGGWSIITKHNL
jgi:ribonuclease/clavin/mitogillin